MFPVYQGVVNIYSGRVTCEGYIGDVWASVGLAHDGYYGDTGAGT